MDHRRIAFFDIDKTIYNGYLIFPVAEHFLNKEIITKDTVDLLYQDLFLYRSKRIDYETTIDNFNFHFAQGLKGQSPEAVLHAAAALLSAREGTNFFPFTGPLFHMLQETHDIYFVTGELQFVGEGVANYFSVQGYVSSEMEIQDTIFTGNIERSLARKEGKRDAVETLLSTYPLPNSMAFGDSEGDIAMLGMVDHAFCINATEGLLEMAKLKGWNIVTPDSIIPAVKKMAAGR